MDTPPANLARSTQRHPDRAPDPSHGASFYDDALDPYDPRAEYQRRRTYGESAG